MTSGRRLYLMRHAKAASKLPEQSDFDRPLMEVGEQKAFRNISKLKESGFIPDVLVASTANRAWATAQIAARVFEYPDSKIVGLKSVYEADAQDLFEIVSEFPSEWRNVMLFGHNPAMTYFAQILSNDNSIDFGTSAIYGIAFKADSWSSVGPASGTIEQSIH